MIIEYNTPTFTKNILMKKFLLLLILSLFTFVGYTQTNTLISTSFEVLRIDRTTNTPTYVRTSYDVTKFIFGDDFISITTQAGEVHVYSVTGVEKSANDYKGKYYYTEQGIIVNIYRDDKGRYNIMVYSNNENLYLIYHFD